MQKINLFNDNIMLKEIVRKDEQSGDNSGLLIPKDNLEDEQVSQGIVVRSNTEAIKVGDVLLFHKVSPVDVSIKLDDDKELETYFFIKEKDIICKIEN